MSDKFVESIPDREIQHTNNHQNRSVWFVDTGHRVVKLLLLTDRLTLKIPERNNYGHEFLNFNCFISLSSSTSKKPYESRPHCETFFIMISLTKNVNVTRTCICDKLVTKLNWTMFLNKSQRNLPRNTNIFKGTSVTYHMMFILFDFLCKKSLHVFLVMYWSLIWLFRFNFSWLNVCGLCFLVRISADLRTEETTAVDHRRRFKAHSTTNEY